MADARDEEHDFDRVEHGGSYTLVCTCGWRSTPSDFAGDVGEQWDRHRAVRRTVLSHPGDVMDNGAKAPTGAHGEVGDRPDAPDRCQVVVVEIAGRRIGIRAEDVAEVQHAAAVTPLPGAPANIDGVLDLRGELIAVLDGRARIGAARRPPRLSDRFVVVRTATRTMAVRVDAAVALSEVAIVDGERTGSLTADLLQGAGLARTVDGLLVVHDVEAFLSVEEAADLERALAERREP